MGRGINIIIFSLVGRLHCRIIRRGASGVAHANQKDKVERSQCESDLFGGIFSETLFPRKLHTSSTPKLSAEVTA